MQMGPKNHPSRLWKPQLGTGFQAQKRSDSDALCLNCDILASFPGVLCQSELSNAGRLLGCFLAVHTASTQFSNSLTRKQNEGLGGYSNAKRQV